jgi:hypothetical protein
LGENRHLPHPYIYRRVFVVKGERAINEERAPKLPLTISATYLTFCFVVVVVVELTAIVVEVEVEVTVVMEEGVALRRGSLVLAPSEEKSTVVLVPPLRYQFYTNSLAPTSWKNSR